MQMKSDEESSEKDSSSSLARGLKVLECFGQDSCHRYTLSELARRLDMPKSSIYRVLKTLSRMDYLRYEEHSKHYYLGVRVLSLGFLPAGGHGASGNCEALHGGAFPRMQQDC